MEDNLKILKVENLHYFFLQSSTQMLAAPYIIPLTNMAMTGQG